MNTIFITGGAGFIGSNLIRLLLAESDCTVVNIDKLTYAGNLASLADVQDNARYRFEQVDIASAADLSRLFGTYKPAAVMHLAAESHVDRSIDDPAAFVRTNIVGTYELLRAARDYWEGLPEPEKSQFRFLHVSTDEVYGSLGFNDPPFAETTAYDPHSPYSASKASSDHLVRAWGHTYGLPILITNCSNNYGPYQFPEKLIPVVILKCLRGESIPVYGRGENVRDWLYVEDHCRALLRVLEAGQPGETYNIGGNNELANIDLVRMICRLLDELYPVSQNSNISAQHADGLSSYAQLIGFVSDRPGHDLRYAIDASKTKQELGWTPVEDRDSGFRRTAQWYLDNEPWWQDILSGSYRLDRLGLATAEAKSP